MNEFQIASDCKGCAELAQEVNFLRLRLARIEAAADEAEKEIFGAWAGKAYLLWREIKG